MKFNVDCAFVDPLQHSIEYLQVLQHYSIKAKESYQENVKHVHT